MNRYAKEIRVAAVALCIMSIGIVSILSPSQKTTGQSPATKEVRQGWFPSASFDPQLACPPSESVGEGPTWEGIHIGKSSLNDLETVLRNLGDYNKSINSIQGESISLSFHAFNEGPVVILGVVYACVRSKDNVISALAVNWIFNYRLMPRIQDFVRVYGVPDAVTWTAEYDSRVVFWFEKGIAISVWAANMKSSMFGRVRIVLYFPFMSSDNYKAVWPYNRTWPEAPIPYGDPIIVDQNPFDFKSIIATITAEPTLTASVTPRP